jgi:hypothetical protein
MTNPRRLPYSGILSPYSLNKHSNTENRNGAILTGTRVRHPSLPLHLIASTKLRIPLTLLNSQHSISPSPKRISPSTPSKLVYSAPSTSLGFSDSTSTTYTPSSGSYSPSCIPSTSSGSILPSSPPPSPSSLRLSTLSQLISRPLSNITLASWQPAFSTRVSNPSRSFRRFSFFRESLLPPLLPLLRCHCLAACNEGVLTLGFH